MADALSLDEKLSEEVRKYPVLYDKSCKEFKDKQEKQAAWAVVAAATALNNGRTVSLQFLFVETFYNIFNIF